MSLAVDHAFITCAAGAPEGNELLRLGFVEGSGNTHPGQGTANRRFFFENFMLELVWVSDPDEARNAQTRRTRLWERCTQRGSGISPFGIVFRAAGDQNLVPFPTWDYHPSYLPQGISIQIAEGTTLQEPELFYLPFLRDSEFRAAEPADHALPIRRIRTLSVGIPNLTALSEASQSARSAGLLSYFESPQPLLEVLFGAASSMCCDLRPVLPLVFRGILARP
jgi:hypothetical protein